MDTYTQTRQQLDVLLVQLATERETLEAREQAVAQATELLSQDAAVRAAWHEGATAERWRIVRLIDHQLIALTGAGTNAIVLNTLRRTVLEVEG